MAKTTVFFDRDRDIFFVVRTKTVGRVYELPRYGDMPPEEVCDALKDAFEAYRVEKHRDGIEIPVYALSDAWSKVIERANREAKTVVRRYVSDGIDGVLKTPGRALDAAIKKAEKTQRDDWQEIADDSPGAVRETLAGMRAEVFYTVTDCGRCGAVEVRAGISNHEYNTRDAKCPKCGETLSGDRVLRFGRDGSSDAKSRAIVAAESMRSRRKREGIRPRVAVFRYKNILYPCDPVRCGMLNERLYKDCAADEVFALTEDGLAFRPSYRGYIEAVAKKGGKVYERILASERRLLSELGEIAKEDGLGMAFYVYIAEHVFNGKELPLHIKGKDGEDYAFKSVRNYASALAALVGSPKAVKVAALFSEHTCGRFFKDYERTSTELSRLIFEHTGSFVIFSEEEKAGRDMGKSFLKDLPVPCPEEEVRLKFDFMNAVSDDEAFWDKVKGGAVYGECPKGNTPYAALCHYAFAIGGHTRLRYLSLDIENSEKGLSYIRNVVINAYIRQKSGEDMAKFKDLVALFGERDLVFSLTAVCGYMMNGENFVDTLFRLLPSVCGDGVPTVETYLACLDRIGQDTLIVFGGRADTLSGHVRRLAGRKDAEDLAASPDIAALFGKVYGASERDEREKARDAFDKMKRSLAAPDEDGKEGKK